MEPQQQPRSTPPPPPGATPPPPPPPAAGSTPPPPAGGTAAAPPAAPPGDPAIIVVICPACGEARAEGARYCEECGHDYGGKTAPEAEDRNFLKGPVLWVFMLFWVLLAIGGLWYLFSLLWAA